MGSGLTGKGQGCGARHGIDFARLRCGSLPAEPPTVPRARAAPAEHIAAAPSSRRRTFVPHAPAIGRASTEPPPPLSDRSWRTVPLQAPGAWPGLLEQRIAGPAARPAIHVYDRPRTGYGESDRCIDGLDDLYRRPRIAPQSQTPLKSCSSPTLSHIRRPNGFTSI